MATSIPTLTSLFSETHEKLVLGVQESERIAAQAPTWKKAAIFASNWTFNVAFLCVIGFTGRALWNRDFKQLKSCILPIIFGVIGATINEKLEGSVASRKLARKIKQCPASLDAMVLVNELIPPLAKALGTFKNGSTLFQYKVTCGGELSAQDWIRHITREAFILGFFAFLNQRENHISESAEKMLTLMDMAALPEELKTKVKHVLERLISRAQVEKGTCEPYSWDQLQHVLKVTPMKSLQDLDAFIDKEGHLGPSNLVFQQPRI